jgi:hypothetical protein
MKNGTMVKSFISALAMGAALALVNPAVAADKEAAETKSVKGEVVDLMCYLDHGAKGEAHKGCAEKCIKSGGPVGLLSGEQLYIVVGDHQPINDQLASKAGQTVTLSGKVVERNGVKLLENAQLEK